MQSTTHYGRLLGALPLPILLATAASAQIKLVEEGDVLTTVVNGPSLVSRIDDVFVNNNADWLLRLDTDGAATEDEVIMFNGNVIFQQGTSTGMTAPVGATFNFLDTAAVTDNGDVMVLANVNRVAGGTTTCLYWNGTLVVEAGVTPCIATGLPSGNVFETVSEVWANNSGQLLISGRTDTAQDFIGVFDHDGMGNLTSGTILSIKNVPLAGHPTPIQGYSFSRTRQAFNDSGSALWFVDDDHTVAGGSTTNDSWIYLDNAPLWREGDPIAAIPGSVYDTLSSAEVDLNNNGDYVLQSGRDASFNLDFIIKNDNTVIAQEGMPVPGVPGGFTLTTIGSTTGVFLSDAGDVLWYGDWDDPDTDIDTGLFLNQTLILQEGVSTINGNVIDTIAATDKTFALSNNGRYLIVEVFTIDPLDPTFNGAYIYDLSAMLGTSYCGPAVPNSSGASAVISAAGSLVVANNDFTLRAHSLPLNAFAFFITSQTQGNTPMAGGSTGTICLAGAVGRGVGNSIVSSGATGVVSVLADLTAMPQPTGSVAVMAGETWNFQCWYRDAVGGSATSNFSDGLSVTFQ
ncbi:MAG: hypothetical protein R3F49_11335 [Planctomycetota bacterium]